MLARKSVLLNLNNTCKRYISNESKKGSKRFIQTIPLTNKIGGPDFYSGLNYSIGGKESTSSSSASVSNSLSSSAGSKWSRHSLTFPSSELPSEQQQQVPAKQRSSAPVRRSRASKFSNRSTKTLDTSASTESITKAPEPSPEATPEVIVTASKTTPEVTETASKVVPAVTATTPKVTETTPIASESPKKLKKARRPLRPRKALITLTSNAVDHLRGLLDQPEPKLIRIGVKNRGCSGLTYHLEYVTEPGKFDETIEQDGVKVLIDSKALFSIVGSEMDWLDDKLSSRFIFKNPNSKGTCGCGESFMV